MEDRALEEHYFAQAYRAASAAGIWFCALIAAFALVALLPDDKAAHLPAALVVVPGLAVVLTLGFAIGDFAMAARAMHARGKQRSAEQAVNPL